jgi:hypothetical protein
MSGFVLGPGAGPAYEFHGATVVIKVSGEATLGQLTVMESVYPPTLSVRPHVHASRPGPLSSPVPRSSTVRLPRVSSSRRPTRSLLNWTGSRPVPS